MRRRIKQTQRMIRKSHIQLPISTKIWSKPGRKRQVNRKKTWSTTFWSMTMSTNCGRIFFQNIFWKLSATRKRAGVGNYQKWTIICHWFSGCFPKRIQLNLSNSFLLSRSSLRDTSEWLLPSWQESGAILSRKRKTGIFWPSIKKTVSNFAYHFIINNNNFKYSSKLGMGSQRQAIKDSSSWLDQ